MVVMVHIFVFYIKNNSLLHKFIEFIYIHICICIHIFMYTKLKQMHPKYTNCIHKHLVRKYLFEKVCFE